MYVRSIISGKRNRLIQEGYNLDLTYITPRIIAMSVPGEGIACLYRNPLKQVANYLNQTHQKDYQVYNLRGHKYDTSKFHGHVFDHYIWEDHNSPSFYLLFEICHQIHTFLQSGVSNVVVIHCTAGKGRTGTIICCYLLYSGMCDTVQDALNYFSEKRFQVPGQGVNYACQQRYVNYFHKLLMGEKLYPSIFWINEVRFYGKFYFGLNYFSRPNLNLLYGCCPYLEIKNLRNNQIIYNQKNPKDQIPYFNQANELTLTLNGETIIYGDSQLTFRNQGYLAEGKIFSITLNTAFLLDNDNLSTQQINNNQIRKITHRFDVNKLDPISVSKDQRFPPGFFIEIDFVLTCKCTTYLSFENKCEECQQKLNEEASKYKMIYNILMNHQRPSKEDSYLFLFGKNQEDLVQDENNLIVSFNIYDYEEEEKQT